MADDDGSSGRTEKKTEVQGKIGMIGVNLC